MAKHTIQDLRQWQALPLDVKVLMTKSRIRQWVNEYGINNVVVSFSGGKDSTVLLHLVREEYPDVRGVFIDTGLEFPEIRDFVKTFDNIEWVKPRMNFKDVIIKYGYPFISKEASEAVDGARTYLRSKKENPDAKAKYEYWYDKVMGIGKYETGEKSAYAQDKYKFFLEAPFNISNRCCKVMKKDPIHRYIRETGYKQMTGQMASESRLRTQQWLKNGCNGFDMAIPRSNPMSFWTDQDVLQYIKENNLPICEVYGNVVTDDEEFGQMSLADFTDEKFAKGELHTTKCNRTGCTFCGFGCHLEKSPNRFEVLDMVSNPNIRDFVMRGGAFAEDGLWKPDNRGLGYWFVMKWINIHGGFDMYIPEYERYEREYGNEQTTKFLYG